MLIAMLLLSVSLACTEVERFQKRRRQAATAAFVQKRTADLKQLSGEMAATENEIKRLEASDQFTGANLKRIKVRLAQYETRLKVINAQHCP